MYNIIKTINNSNISLSKYIIVWLLIHDFDCDIENDIQIKTTKEIFKRILRYKCIAKTIIFLYTIDTQYVI